MLVRIPMLVLSALLALACEGVSTGDQLDDSSGPAAWGAVGNGTYNNCGITTAGSAYCWGFDLVTGCPQNTCAVWSAPTAVAGATQTFSSVSTGGGFTCAVATTADAHCWGGLYPHGLGDGVTATSASPVRVSIPAQVREVKAGFQQACALTVDNVVYCWPTYTDPMPEPVRTAVRFKAISPGNTQACGIDVNDDAYCWGSGYGSLGIGARDTACALSPSCFGSPVPQLVDGGMKWSSISAGNAFTCGVTLDHRGFCWGAVYDSAHQAHTGVLGNGTITGSKSPVPVSGALAFKQIATGTRHACGLTLEGTAYCWGMNSTSQLGVGSLGGVATTPQRVIGSLTFESISVAEDTCGVTVHKNIFCWGIPPAFGVGDYLGQAHSIPARLAAPRP